MTAPKISIIIPVYNVEKFLRQCLDSIVNQTMREIQIICVNDGSMDNSRTILHEYADRDSRIIVIDKPNGGLSAARNAAYPHIQGKYTLFVDSDDWIALDLCEKTFAKAERSDADIIFFFWQEEPEQKKKCANFLQIPPQDTTTVQEKIPLLERGYIWNKLWRSDFLFDNHLTFPEGLYFEDILFSWQGITKARRIFVIPEHFYHHRDNPHSVVNSCNKTGFDTIPIYKMIEQFLRTAGYYDDYREVFIRTKLSVWCWCHGNMTRSNQSKIRRMICESLTEEDRMFYRVATNKNLRRTVRLFYNMLDGNRIDALKYHFFETLKLPEHFLREWIIIPLRLWWLKAK